MPCFDLTGPEPRTGADTAEKLSAALKRPVTPITLTPSELAAMLLARGLPPTFAGDVAALAREVADGSLAATSTAVHDLTGRPARTFDQFLAANSQALHATFPAGL
jgi:NAD(P)H dehydrogenase (quinone)